MIMVSEARAIAAGKLKSKMNAWAALPATALTSAIPLKPPTEGQVLKDQHTAETWVRDWAHHPLPDGVAVDREHRSWRNVGKQLIPVRIQFTDIHAVARFAGGNISRDWKLLWSRAETLRTRLGESDALSLTVRRNATKLLVYTDAAFAQLIEVSEWLVDHPVTDLRPRQLPIRGVDSKWFQRNRSIVTALVTSVTTESDLGVVDSDPLIRLRILDGRLTLGGIADFSAPPTELAELDWSPSTVLIVENLETVLAMPPWPGLVVVHGAGFAVNTVTQLPWVQRARVIYWGDLDSHGFAILNRVRTRLPKAESILMDSKTLIENRDLWVPEPSPAKGNYPNLTPAEQQTLTLLHDEGNVRLEQERIPWRAALISLEQVAR